MSGASLTLAGATVRYGGPAGPAQLLDADLRVAPAECVALVGPNGAGKTTALRALLGLAPLTAGSALVAGRPVADWSRAELARHVAVVSQREEPVFPVTAREVVEMGRYPHLGPWQAPTARDCEAVSTAMQTADVARLADRWVETLSGGEWQRVRLARALAQQPRVLVLDEPTAALDVRHEMELFELVTTLVRREGLAALIVSHHINLAARFADRLVLMSEGRVVADGRPGSVLSAQQLTEVFGWPIAVRELSDGTPWIYPLRRPGAGTGVRS